MLVRTCLSYLPVLFTLIRTTCLSSRYLPVIGAVRFMEQIPVFLPAVSFRILVVTFLPSTVFTSPANLAVQVPEAENDASSLLLVIKLRLVFAPNFIALGAFKPIMN